MKAADAVASYIDAFSQGDVNRFIQTFGAEGTYRDPATLRPVTVSEMPEYFGSLFGAFSDMSTQTLALDWVSETEAVWRWIFRATNTGSFRGAPPTGRRIEITGCEFIEVRSGRVHRVEAYLDRLSLVTQLGLVVTPSAPLPA